MRRIRSSSVSSKLGEQVERDTRGSVRSFDDVARGTGGSHLASVAVVVSGNSRGAWHLAGRGVDRGRGDLGHSSVRLSPSVSTDYGLHGTYSLFGRGRIRVDRTQPRTVRIVKTTSPRIFTFTSPTIARSNPTRLEQGALKQMCERTAVRYRGRRLPNGRVIERRDESIPGRGSWSKLSPLKSLRLRNHSPDGFE
jgi:hypothetical protein